MTTAQKNFQFERCYSYAASTLFLNVAEQLCDYAANLDELEVLARKTWPNIKIQHGLILPTVTSEGIMGTRFTNTNADFFCVSHQ